LIVVVVVVLAQGGGELLFGTTPVAMGGCECECKYTVNQPKLYILLILTGGGRLPRYSLAHNIFSRLFHEMCLCVAIFWMLELLWRSLRNFFRKSPAYHKLLTVSFAVSAGLINLYFLFVRF
jgi:hypothetical protein